MVKRLPVPLLDYTRSAIVLAPVLLALASP